MGQVFDLDIAGDLKLVLLALADHAADDGSRVYPSVDRLAGKCSMSESSIHRRLGELRDLGVLEVVAKGGGRGKPTQYRLNLKGARLTPFDAAERVSGQTERVSGGTKNGVTRDTRIVRNRQRNRQKRFSSRDARDERADVDALLERWPRVTTAQRATLDEVLDRHDVNGPAWAADIIRATPPDADPFAAVMAADRSWQREQRDRVAAEERAWAETKATEGRDAERVLNAVSA